jgi:hypothetical protein
LTNIGTQVQRLFDAVDMNAILAALHRPQSASDAGSTQRTTSVTPNGHRVSGPDVRQYWGPARGFAAFQPLTMSLPDAPVDDHDSDAACLSPRNRSTLAFGR